MRKRAGRRHPCWRIRFSLIFGNVQEIVKETVDRIHAYPVNRTGFYKSAWHQSRPLK
jgi:hypothetical protein